VALSQSATPAALEDCRREIQHLEVEAGILERERAAGAGHAERLPFGHDALWRTPLRAAPALSAAA
jgi:type VI secretion system protein VasG